MVIIIVALWIVTGFICYTLVRAGEKYLTLNYNHRDNFEVNNYPPLIIWVILAPIAVIPTILYLVSMLKSNPLNSLYFEITEGIPDKLVSIYRWSK